MRVAVTGASGFVGQHVVRQLTAQGHEVRGLSRGGEGLARIRAAGGAAFEGNVERPGTLAPFVQGTEAVVHLVAIIRERGGQTFDGVIRGGAWNVASAAKEAGVRRFLHMSALGAVDDARYPYLQAKWRAQEAVRASGLDWTILRPSLLFGAGDRVFTMLAEMARKQPLMPVIGRGDMRLQPLWVEDLARIVERCLADAGTIGKEYELGGPEPLRYEAMLDAVMEAAGKQRTKVHVPVPVMRVVAAGMGLAMREPPITPGELALLVRGDNVTDPDSVRKHFGFEPRRLRDGLDHVRGPRVPAATASTGAGGSRGPV